MSHSFYKIWLHVVFSTKNRNSLIYPEFENNIYKNISDELTELGCLPRIINGTHDHIHMLFLQNPNQTITQIVKQLKGSTSHKINFENWCPEKFSWQTGFSVFSVSESQTNKVHQYIFKQKEHHASLTFEEEHSELLKLHRFKIGN